MLISADQSYSESFAAEAESVPAARDAVTRYAIEAGVVGERLDAIRLAASEAVTNAVVHAYAAPAPRDEPGVIQLTLSCIDGELWVLVGDEGGGIRPRGRGNGLGLGLVLIAELADDFQILSRGGGGTELRMRFKLGAGARFGRAQPRGSLSIAASPA